MNTNKNGIALRIIAVAILVIVVITSVGIWYIYTNQQQTSKEEGEPIKIAILTNLSGAYAPESIRARFTMTAWTTEINVNGGVYLSGTGKYHPIELMFYDGESNVQRCIELATKVATEKIVHAATLVGFHPVATAPAVINMEKIGGLPIMCMSPIDTIAENCLPAIPENKFTWSWHASFNGSKLGMLWINFLSQYKSKITKIGTYYSDDISGRNSQKRTVPGLEEKGFAVYFPGFVPPGTKDFTALITKFKEEGVDVVLVSTTPSDWIIFRRQCAGLGFKPKMFGVERCQKPDDAAALGKELAEYVITGGPWWYTFPFKGNEWYRDNWEKVLGDMSMTQAEGFAYTGFHMILEAVKIAGVLDREAINNAFSKIDTEMPIGRVKFGPNHMCETAIALLQYFVNAKGKWDMQVVYSLPGSGIESNPAVFPIP